MYLRKFSYIRNKGTKNEWAIKGSPFEESALKLNELNLIVGQNATGKSRTVTAICDLADLVSGNKTIEQLVYNTAIFEATFEVNDMLTDYKLELKDGKVIDEQLTIRFDAEPDDVVNDDDNVIILREGTAEMDMAQTLYDLICVSLPMQKVHPEGGCNPVALSHLGDEADAATDAPANTPFSGLKELLKQKKN